MVAVVVRARLRFELAHQRARLGAKLAALSRERAAHSRLHARHRVARLAPLPIVGLERLGQRAHVQLGGGEEFRRGAVRPTDAGDGALTDATHHPTDQRVHRRGGLPCEEEKALR